MVLAPENGGRSSTVTSAVRFTLTMLLVGGGFSLLLSFLALSDTQCVDLLLTIVLPELLLQLGKTFKCMDVNGY